MATPAGTGSIPLNSSAVLDDQAPKLTLDADAKKAWMTRIFFGAQIVAALILLAGQLPKLHGDLEILVLLIALNVATELMPISIYGSSYISVGFTLTMAIIILFGAPGVVLAAPIEAVAGRVIGRRIIDYQAITTSARYIVVYAIGAAAYGVFARSNPPDFAIEMIPAAAAATVACFGLSAFFVVTRSHLLTGEPLAAAWEKSRWVAPHYAALGVLGLALATAYIAAGVIGIVAFMTPALMMRLAMKQYVDKTAENVAKLQDQNEALQKANIEIRQVSEELRLSYDGTLEALVSALDARDQETKGHSIRVSHYMLDIAREIGVKEDSQEWVDMQRGSLLHDVGKIGVSDTILLKPGKLTAEEWELMRLHPEIGYNMLRQVNFLQGAAEIVLSHHERWDGQGYPHGLRAEEIPLGARIFSVVDTFDSMTSDRPYRKALGTVEALNEILHYSGSQFDPMVVEAFLDIYETWAKEREELHSLTQRSAAA